MELPGSNVSDHAAFLRGNTAMLTSEEKSERRMVYGTLLAMSGSILIIAATVAVQMKKGWPWCQACSACWRSLSERCRARGQKGPYSKVADAEPQQVALVAGLEDDAEETVAAAAVEVEEKPQPQEEEQQAILPATAEEVQEVGEKVLDAERGLRSTHEKFVRMRRMLLGTLFVFYVSCSVGLPYLNASQASCINGFFWEDHLPFLFLFLVTKALELMVYVNDPTMEEARLEWFSFMMTFVPSFLGYIDAYTDATAIVITTTCPAEGADLLAKWMIGFYILGVIIAQWMVALTMACGDETHACLMKLIHWDTCASCISLPPENKSAWVAVNLARTFLEDIPQAVLQSIFLLRIRPNPFMLISVAIGVCSSVKGVVDAAKRGVAAAAAFARALEQVRARPKAEGLLTVRVLRGKFGRSGGEVPNPYVTLRLESQPDRRRALRTRVMQRNLNPQWDQSFDLQIDREGETLICEAMSRDNIGVDDRLGSLQVPVDPIVAKPNQSIPIADDLQDSAGGRLELELSFAPAGTTSSPDERTGAQRDR